MLLRKQKNDKVVFSTPLTGTINLGTFSLVIQTSFKWVVCKTVIKINTEVVNGKTLAKSITFLDNTGAKNDVEVPLDELNLNPDLKRVLIGIPSRVNRQ